MRHFKFELVVVLVCAMLLTVVSQAGAQGSITTLTFVSDTTWEVTDADPSGPGPVNSLGFAQKVCLHASAPSPCPSGATLYGFPSTGWSADLSSISGAAWIWAPGITGATSPAFPAEFFFSKAFNLPGAPTAGAISVAVDDFAQVRVNGVAVGTTGSVTDMSLAGAGQSSLATFDITSFLAPGTNIITIRGANGPFACGAGPYNCNPAGVVFGGSLSFQSAIEVSIDIKPGSFPNSINSKSKGTIPVAILSTADFDAPTQVDRTSLTFGRTGDEASLAFCTRSDEDVNGDGLLDIVCHFRTHLTAFQVGDTEGILKGKTVGGVPIEGRDSVRIVK